VDGKLDLAFIDNGNFFQAQYPIDAKTVLNEEFILVCSKRYYQKFLQGDP